MKLRIKEYINSPIGVWYRICIELKAIFSTVFLSKPPQKYPEEKPARAEQTAKNLIDYLATGNVRRKSVVYTCVINDYDKLERIATPFIDFSWDYICFTDNKKHIQSGQVGVWKIKPLARVFPDKTITNRWHKFHPADLFPDYEESLYIDANVEILTKWIFTEIASRDTKILLPLHPSRNCIFQEYKVVLASFLDNPQKIISERRIIKQSGMPLNYGLTENNIFYRKHNDPIVKDIMSECWQMINNFSKRDQLCLTWILWKHGIRIPDIAIPSPHYDLTNFFLHRHVGTR